LSENKLEDREYVDIQNYITNGQVSPSMRLFATAGKESRRNNISVYNCAYTPINSIQAIIELLWLSMSGVGVGYSVENKYIEQLPEIGAQVGDMAYLAVYDSAEGWVEAFAFALNNFFVGRDVVFDYSLIRPAGAPLKTKGGTASGPGVLKDLIEFTRDLIFKNQGKRLRPIDVFDICTKIGSCAVSGGSRRSAQLVMFDFDDDAMRYAKFGPYWVDNPHRSNANISVVVDKELEYSEVSDLMNTMFSGQTGEPNIVSRLAMNNTKPERRRYMHAGGVNACSEVNLQGATIDGRMGGEFCNLSSVQVYPADDTESLERKVRIATTIGTIQSLATNFRLLRPTWKEICEEERLLGVCLIGLMDNEIARKEEVLKHLLDIARITNVQVAHRLGIMPSAAITAIKPSGNSSVLYDVARGINARYAPYYIRRVRVNAYTPMYHALKDSGIPMYPENGQGELDADTYVATFYCKSPDGAITTDQLSALEQMEMWKTAKLSWCEHNPSVTIEYQEHEHEDIINWVYQNQKILNGMAFLPRNNHIYEQAPYEEITKEEYESAISSYPEIDWSLLTTYETHDTTIRELECSAGVCELV
jgi:ribonucleoside-diphosphate reductase alpha chain